MHLFNMLAHLGLVVAVAISYIYDLGRTTQSIPQGHSAVADVSACNLASMARAESGFTFDTATHTLLKACLIAVSSVPPPPVSAPPPLRRCPIIFDISVTYRIFLARSLRGLSGLPSTSLLLSCFWPSNRTESH